MRWRAAKPLAQLAASMRALGPYAAIWLLLPGGSVIALCLWALRHPALGDIHRRRILIAVAALSGLLIFPTGA